MSDQEKFRSELEKRMPGYSWTVHRQLKSNSGLLEATGIQSSGMNRISTLSVERREVDGAKPLYEVRSAGYGAKAPWAASDTGYTLAQALRGLQDHYTAMARHYSGLADALEAWRNPVKEG